MPRKKGKGRRGAKAPQMVMPEGADDVDAFMDGRDTVGLGDRAVTGKPSTHAPPASPMWSASPHSCSRPHTYIYTDDASNSDSDEEAVMDLGNAGASSSDDDEESGSDSSDSGSEAGDRNDATGMQDDDDDDDDDDDNEMGLGVAKRALTANEEELLQGKGTAGWGKTRKAFFEDGEVKPPTPNHALHLL